MTPFNEARETVRTRGASRWAAVAAISAGVGLLVWMERRRALRRPSGSMAGHEGERVLTNLAIAGISAAATHVAMVPVIAPLASWVERERIGVTQRIPAAAWIRDALAIVMLDWTLYWWHVAEHRIPWLYRFHRVHHADLKLDTSTALRFHAGEFLASVPWRAAQVALIGASPRAVRTWQRLTMLSVLFHHSNLRLPLWLERRLARVIVTPRLHGIHHSVVREEQDSNWSSGFTLWDRLHGTYRANVPQADVVIGIAGYQHAEDVTFARSLTMPLEPLDEAGAPLSRVTPGHMLHVPRDVMVG